MTSEKNPTDSVFTDLMNPKFVQKELKLIPPVHSKLAEEYFLLYTTKDKKSSIRVYCELWDHVIVIKEGQNKKTIGFMDVSYSRLKLTISPEEKKLRLIKNKKYEELWSDDEEVLNRWYHTLGRFCIYSSFRVDYDLVGVLGKGNFAKVYLVEERDTKKKFSAKIFDKQLIKDDEFEKVCRSSPEMFPLRDRNAQGS